jgi:hypothetical protein
VSTLTKLDESDPTYVKLRAAINAVLEEFPPEYRRFCFICVEPSNVIKWALKGLSEENFEAMITQITETLASAKAG